MPPATHSGGAHCSSLAISHFPPAATSSRHPLPSSGQNAPRGQDGGTSSEWCSLNCVPSELAGSDRSPKPKGNSSLRQRRGWHDPLVCTSASGVPSAESTSVESSVADEARQKVVSSHSWMNLCVSGSMCVEEGLQGPPRGTVPPAATDKRKPTIGSEEVSMRAGWGTRASRIRVRLDVGGKRREDCTCQT